MNSIVISALVVMATCLAVTHGVNVCFSDQWEGHVDQKSINFVKSEPQYRKIDAAMSFDLTNRRSTTMLSYALNGVVKKYQILTLFKGGVDNGTVYTVDLQLGKCFKKPTKAPFSTGCLPPDCVFAGKFHLGMGDSTLPVIDYNCTIKEVPIIYTVTPVDKDHVVPILGRGHNVKQNDYLKGFIFFDFTLGIKDPSVFDIPKICQQESSSDFYIPEDLIQKFSFV